MQDTENSNLKILDEADLISSITKLSFKSCLRIAREYNYALRDISNPNNREVYRGFLEVDVLLILRVLGIPLSSIISFKAWRTIGVLLHEEANFKLWAGSFILEINNESYKFVSGVIHTKRCIDGSLVKECLVTQEIYPYDINIEFNVGLLTGQILVEDIGYDLQWRLDGEGLKRLNGYLH